MYHLAEGTCIEDGLLFARENYNRGAKLNFAVILNSQRQEWKIDIITSNQKTSILMVTKSAIAYIMLAYIR